MNFDEYQEWCVTKWKTDNSHRDQMLECALGLGESGESQDIIKKHVFHGHDLDENGLKKELGDQLYYIATMCTLTGVKLSDVANVNKEKLNARYPNGFEKDRSINRDE